MDVRDLVGHEQADDAEELDLEGGEEALGMWLQSYRRVEERFGVAICDA